MTRWGLIKKLDRVLSTYVRKRAADHAGYVVCVTCDKSLPWQEAENGHYIRRQHFAARFNLKNMHPQCNDCNQRLAGNEKKYKAFIVEKYGEETHAELVKLKKSFHCPDTDALKALIKIHTELTKEFT